MPKTMQDILRDTPRFCSRASYFSGRGATLTDLNYEILEHIHGQITSEFGEEAAKNYVKMVASMKSCSATAFINNCYSLEMMNYKWADEESSTSGIDVEKDKDGNYDTVNGIFGMISAMHQRGDDTPSIRNRFLSKHGHTPENGDKIIMFKGGKPIRISKDGHTYYEG